jgi:hypothetical protein
LCKIYHRRLTPGSNARETHHADVAQRTPYVYDMTRRGLRRIRSSPALHGLEKHTSHAVKEIMNMPSRRCLSADERLQLIEELRESLDQDDIPLTEEQRANSTAGSPSTK